MKPRNVSGIPTIVIAIRTSAMGIPIRPTRPTPPARSGLVLTSPARSDVNRGKAARRIPPRRSVTSPQ